MSLLIVHGLIVTAEREFASDILVEGGRIAKIGSLKGMQADRVLDASGLIVVPGGVDVHTHLEAPVGGMVSSDDFETGTRAAAFGGTTCIIDFATQARGEKLMNVLERWRARGEKSVVDYGLHMIVTDIRSDRIETLDDLVRAGVTSFKVFMAYPDALMLDDGSIFRIMQRAAKLGALVSVHAENGSVIEQLICQALARGNTAPIYHALTRPPAAESEATNRAIALGAMAGAPLYIVHVSCAEALEAVSRARSTGGRVFAETCPQYLLLSSEELRRPGFEGAKYVLTPPLRARVDHERLWEGLTDGDLQVVATDHCPFFFKRQKEAGIADFTKIPNGGPGIEHRLELLFEYGVNKERIALQRWVDLCSTAPARLFGLYPRKGELAVGSDADILLWDPAQPWTISASNHHMNVDYSLYEGYTGKGRPKFVIAGGEVLVEEGTWVGGSRRGRYVVREPFAVAYQ